MASSPAAKDIRDVLFGDMPLNAWARPGGQAAQAAPWSLFAAASDHLERGDRPAAIEALRKVVGMRGLESRHYLQAWQALGDLDEPPDADQASRMLGVVVEVGLDGGLDLLAAYADRTARYINFSGAAVVWDSRDPEIDGLIADLFAAAQPIATYTEVWQDARPPAPSTGHMRINVLTPGGLHFGQGTFEALGNDPLGGLVVRAATALMRALIGRVSKGRSRA
jgi:hypothetical protein